MLYSKDWDLMVHVERWPTALEPKEKEDTPFLSQKYTQLALEQLSLSNAYLSGFLYQLIQQEIPAAVTSCNKEDNSVFVVNQRVP